MKSGTGLPVFRRSATATGNRKAVRSSSPADRHVTGSLIRICLHAVACIASLILGFRFSREALLVLVLKQPDVPVFKVPARIDAAASTNAAISLSEADVSLRFPYVAAGGGGVVVKAPEEHKKSSRVHVGRHEILVRPWPHPNKAELYKAHALVELVQREQRSLYGPKNWRPIIAITTTFRRTFQAIHLGEILHTVRSIPGPVVWIVVEAGGRSNETASFLDSAAGIQCIHLAFEDGVPTTWDQRRQTETRLRIEGLRYVRNERLDGLIVFADDSNVHTLELFDEVQRVNWIGALSVGLLRAENGQESGSARARLPVQGPACNESCHVIGWHAPGASPIDEDTSFVDVLVAGGVTDVARHLEWCGFVINSRAIWQGNEDKPEWIRDWDEWISGDDMASIGSPLKLARDQANIEALGNCGRDILMWWIRVEARADSHYPSRWELESPLEVVVPAKRTPWPEFVESQLPAKSGSGSGSTPSRRSSSSSSSRQKQPGSRRSKRKQSQQQQQQQQQQEDVKLGGLQQLQQQSRAS